MPFVYLQLCTRTEYLGTQASGRDEVKRDTSRMESKKILASAVRITYLPFEPVLQYPVSGSGTPMPSPSRPPQKREPFTPRAKGSLDVALQSPEALQEVAPRLMRPVALLDGMRVLDQVTVQDMAIWELCASVAQEQGLEKEEHSVPLSQVKALLGKNARTIRVELALRRLRLAAIAFDMEVKEIGKDGKARKVRKRGERSYLSASFEKAEDQAEMITFTIPKPIRDLLMAPGRYVHLELAALPLMDSHYSVVLYQQLLARMPVPKKGPWREEQYEIRLTPTEIAKAVGFDVANKRVGVDFGALNRSVLVPAQRDLQHVKRFRTEVELVRSARRGREVEEVVFRTTTLPPNWRELKGLTINQMDIELKSVSEGKLVSKTQSIPRVEMSLISFPDEPGRHVVPQVFQRAAANLGIGKRFMDSRIRLDLDQTSAWTEMNTLYPHLLRQGWMLALYEADLGRPMAPGFYDRQFRGGRLLEALKTRNPSDVCWDVLLEEARELALIPAAYDLPSRIKLQIEKDRYQRFKASKRTPEQAAKRAQRKLPIASEVPEYIVESAIHRTAFDVMVDRTNVTPKPEEQRLLDQMESTEARGALTSAECKARKERIKENALAARITAVRAFLDALRANDPAGGVPFRIKFSHRGNEMQIKVDPVCLAADHLAALRAMDGVAEVREKY